MKIQIIIGVISCLLCNDALSQIDKGKFNASIPEEKVALHSNTNVLLAGETLYYKLYCLTNANQLSNASKIAYVELIGSKENRLFKHKLKLVDGLIDGDFFIPPSVQTGNYKLVAYTKWTNNNDIEPFYQKDIYIINPFVSSEILFDQEVVANNQKDVEIKKKNTITYHENYDIKLQTDSDFYKIREKVELTLNNVLREVNYGNYSLSIRKLDSLEITKNNSDKILFKENSEFYLPEIRGEIISGQIISKVDNAMSADKIVALSIPGSQYIHKNVKTDKQGKFYFNIYENYNDNNAIIQVLDENKDNYSVLLDDTSFKYTDQLGFNRIKLNVNIKDWLLKQSIHNQIENAYHNSKRDSVLYREPAKAFYGNPTIKYCLDDYKRFSTLKETFVEVIEEAAVRKSNDQYKFKVYNYEELRNNEFKDYQPLVIVDGILIQNNSDILNYDCYKIECVNLVRGIYFYGPSIFNGVIDIKTKEGDFNLQKNREGLVYFDLESTKENKIYYSPNYKTQFEDLKRIPDYRNQLLWIPDLTLDSNLKTIEFYTSDITGVFEIVLQGYNLGGRYLESIGYIEIKKD